MMPFLFPKKMPMLLLTIAALLLFVFPSLASASEIKGLAIEPQIKAIFLSWDKMMLQETEAVVVIRKEESCPQNAYDGKEIYRGNGTMFLDKKVSENVKYCYGVYIYNSLGTPMGMMKTSGLFGVVSFWKYIGDLFQKNYFLVGGVTLVVILNLLNIRKRRRWTKRI